MTRKKGDAPPNRLNIEDRKKEALGIAHKTKSLASALKNLDTLERIKNIEAAINSAKIDHRYPNIFLKNEIDDLERIQADLDKERLKFLGPKKWRVIVGLDMIYLFNFLGFYTVNLPEKASTDQTFYITLAVVFSFFLIIFSLITYHLFSVFYLKFLLPSILKAIRKLPEKRAKAIGNFVNIVYIALFFGGSILLSTYLGIMVPQWFSPSVAIAIENAKDTSGQWSTSALIVTLLAIIAIVSFLALIFKPLLKVFQKMINNY